MYTAVLLNDSSKLKLQILWRGLALPRTDEWQEICHHVTINMGTASKEDRPVVGKEVSIVVDGLGVLPGRVAAFRVVSMRVAGQDLVSANKQAHITAAVNVAVGAKPVESNQIVAWETMPRTVFLTGTLLELN